MPDTPIEPPSRQPYDPGLESRVERLEASMIAVQADIAGIRTDVAFMRGQLQELSSLKGDVARLASEVARLAIEVAGISGQLKHMPSTWAMIVAIMAGQATLAGVLFAALRLSSGHF